MSMENIRLGQWDRVHTQVTNAITTLEKEGTPIIYSQQRILQVLWMTSRVLSESGIDTQEPGDGT